MKFPKKGVSLIELLISMSIAFFITGVLFLCFSREVRVLLEAEKKSFLFRQVSISLARICRELRDTAYFLYSPDLEDLFAPSGCSTIIFAKDRFQSNEKEVVSYRFDNDSKKILRTLYEPNFDPLEVSKQKPVSEEILAEKVDFFSICFDENLLFKVIICFDKNNFLQTKISNKLFLSLR